MKEDFRKFYRSLHPFKMTEFDDRMATLIPLGVQTPYILEEREMRATQIDVFSRLMAERQIFFSSQVDDNSASIIIAQLLYLDSLGEEDITMYIMTGGGSCSSGLGICDTMDFIKSDVSTINVSMAASMGSLLLACGTKGKRLSLPNASVLIHQPLIGGGGLSGPTADILIEAKQMELLREKLFRILASRTGQPYEKILEDAARDFWLTAEESLKYGIVDKIITTDPK